jgi:hypothetical protein
MLGLKLEGVTVANLADNNAVQVGAYKATIL